MSNYKTQYAAPWGAAYAKTIIYIYERGGELSLFKLAHRLPARETRFELVPMGDLLFSQPPAEIDIASLMATDEVDQTRLGIFQLTANFSQLVGEVFKAVDRFVQAMLRRRGGRLGLYILLREGYLALHANDVGHNAANQGKRAVGLFERESPLGS